MELLKIAWDFNQFVLRFREPEYRVRLPIRVAVPDVNNFPAQRR